MTQQDIPEPANAEETPANAEAPAAAEEGVASPNREAELEAELATIKDQLLRAVAETENVRRRLEQQAEERGKYAVSSFAKDILQVADNLQRALDSIPESARQGDKLAEGVELTQRGLTSTLERYGIKRIETKGQRFDPHLHQAMMEVEDPNQPSGTVVLEMQAGYTIADRLLRPAMVGVSKGGPKPAPEVDTQA